MTVLLALDCAAGACSVALFDGRKPQAHEACRLSRGHAEVLMPMVDRVLKAAGRTAGDIDAVAATVGPGSFTGLRIGLAAARGLALAVGARTVPVTTLEALAHAAGPSDTPVLAALDTKRGDLYAQWFDAGGVPVGAPAAMEADAALSLAPAQRVRLVGDSTGLLAERAAARGLDAAVVDGSDVPDARHVAALAVARLETDGPGELRPLYLRAPAVNLAPS